MACHFRYSVHLSSARFHEQVAGQSQEKAVPSTVPKLLWHVSGPSLGMTPRGSAIAHCVHLQSATKLLEHL